MTSQPTYEERFKKAVMERSYETHANLWQGLLCTGSTAICAEKGYRKSPTTDIDQKFCFAIAWVMAMDASRKVIAAIPAEQLPNEKRLDEFPQELETIRNAIAHWDERIANYMREGQRKPPQPTKPEQQSLGGGALKRIGDTSRWVASGELTIVGARIVGGSAYVPLSMVKGCIVTNTRDGTAELCVENYDTAKLLCTALGLVLP